MSTELHPDPAPPPPAAPPSEEAAWAEVLATWSDEAAHRRYLALFQSLEALAVAGARYKAVLDERPDDAMARLMRGEIVKKATAYALATLPRTPSAVSKGTRRLRLAVALLAGVTAVWAAFKLAALLLGARS
jgi:hypothetical protein